MTTDPHQLQRFTEAQSGVWDAVLAELQAGRKTSHWMWFVFPQLAVLGRSSTARFYGISGLEEARAYLSHPVLGPRLIHCCKLLLQTGTRGAADVFGQVDAMKLRSCLTLFAAVAPGDPVFGNCLEHFFNGEADALTLQHLAP